MAFPQRRQTGAWVDQLGPEARVVLRHDLPIPVPGPGEVLVKLECSGVWCAFDS